MTAVALLLEDFGNPMPGRPGNGLPDGAAVDGAMTDADALEEARLAGFEAGFRAGWDDATTALSDADAATRAAALAKLQEISFGFLEARTHLLAQVGPLLEAILARILPDLARHTLGAAVLEAVLPRVRAAAGAPLDLRLHPDSLRTVQAFLNDAAAPAIRLTADPALGPGDAILAPGPGEDPILIDGDSLVAAILEHLHEALAAAQETAAHG